MKLEGTVYCEGPDCEHHAHVGPDTMGAKRLPPGFVRLVWYGSGNGDTEYAFCGVNCAMKWAAGFDPPEIIEFGGSV